MLSGEKTQMNPGLDTDLPLQLVPSRREDPCDQEATVRGTIPGCLSKLFPELSLISRALASPYSGAGVQT